MPKFNQNKEITLKPDAVYLIANDTDEGDVHFETIDTFDDDKADDDYQASLMLIRCLVRGMIETSCQNPAIISKLGEQAFLKDGDLEPKEKPKNGVGDNVLKFSKPVGNC